MIFVLNSSAQRVGVIKQVVDAERLEEINGENTLDFTVKSTDKMRTLLTEDCMFEYNNDYFDLAVLTQEIDSNGENIIHVEADHVSYRLNHKDYDMDSFYKYSTYSVDLWQILYGTPFTRGTVEFYGGYKYQVDEKMSRRQLLMNFVELIEAELDFNKFQISLLKHRGSSTPTTVVKDKDIEVVSKSVNRRTINTENKTTISYKCTPIYKDGVVFNLGDEISLRQNSIGINETLRATRISYNPYDISKVEFEFTDYVNELRKSTRNSRSWNICRGIRYCGVALDSDNGLTCEKPPTDYIPPVEDPPEPEVLADPRYATIKVNNVEGVLVRTTDDTGLIENDRFYLEHDDENADTNLVFNGKLGDNVIENQLDPLYGGGGGGGGEVIYLNLRTTTLYADVSSSGAFVTNTWTHGYDLSTQIVRFFGAPKFYDENYIVEDWAIEIVSNTQVRIVGHVTVVS